MTQEKDAKRILFLWLLISSRIQPKFDPNSACKRLEFCVQTKTMPYT
jgi:hypothetical protein